METWAFIINGHETEIFFVWFVILFFFVFLGAVSVRRTVFGTIDGAGFAIIEFGIRFFIRNGSSNGGVIGYIRVSASYSGERTRAEREWRSNILGRGFEERKRRRRKKT